MDDDDIKRKAAIDAVHKSIFDFFDICDDDEESPMTYKDKRLLELNKAITTQIKAVPSTRSVTLMNWIPCSKRMPIIKNNFHKRARVLITTSWGLVKDAYYCVDHWKINDIDYKLTSVIAWMPLPEPYKEGEQDE